MQYITKYGGWQGLLWLFATLFLQFVKVHLFLVESERRRNVLQSGPSTPENRKRKNFTTSFGIKLRKYLYKPLQIPLRLATKQKIVLEQYPSLEKGKPYIFASTHSFCEDINAALAVLDRNAYLLLGSTDQLEHNPGAYGVWANGMVYVNRLNKESRKNALKKMERLLNSGTSVLIFPEGAYNNTENLLCEQLFSGFYWLSKSTGAQVVPVASFCEYQSDKIYIKFESPLDLAGKTKDEAKVHLRNLLGIMMQSLAE